MNKEYWKEVWKRTKETFAELFIVPLVVLMLVLILSYGFITFCIYIVIMFPLYIFKGMDGLRNLADILSYPLVYILRFKNIGESVGEE